MWWRSLEESNFKGRVETSKEISGIFQIIIGPPRRHVGKSLSGTYHLCKVQTDANGANYCQTTLAKSMN